MRLRKECEHGRWEEHSWIEGAGVPFDELRGVDCPGGEVLSEETLVIEKIEAERIIARAIAGYHMTVGDAVDAAGVIVDALASQVGESG